jgi:hypothetical protein
MKPWKACTAGKAKQKNVPKTSSHEPATSDVPHVFFDTSTVKKPKNGPNVTKPVNCGLMLR